MVGWPEEACTRFWSALQEWHETLESKEQNLLDNQREWNDDKDLVSSVNDNTDNIVRLKFGPRLFHTSKRTVTSVPDSMLAVQWSGEWGDDVCSDGYVHFDDRDPAIFLYLLEYMRDRSQLWIKSGLEGQLIEEASFFSLDPYLSALEGHCPLDEIFIGDEVIAERHQEGFPEGRFFGEVKAVELRRRYCTVTFKDGGTTSLIPFSKVQKTAWIGEHVMLLAESENAWYFAVIVDILKGDDIDSDSGRSLSPLGSDDSTDGGFIKKIPVQVQIGIGKNAEKRVFPLSTLVGCNTTPPAVQLGAFHACTTGGGNGSCFIQPTSVSTGDVFTLQWNYSGLHFVGRAIVQANTMTVGCVCLANQVLFVLQYQILPLRLTQMDGDDAEPDDPQDPRLEGKFAELPGGFLVGREVAVMGDTQIQHEVLQWMGTINNYHIPFGHDLCALAEVQKMLDDENPPSAVAKGIIGKYRAIAPNEDPAVVIIKPVDDLASAEHVGVYSMQWDFPHVFYFGKGILNKAGTQFSAVSSPSNSAADFQVVVYDVVPDPMSKGRYTLHGRWMSGNGNYLLDKKMVSVGSAATEDLTYMGPI